MTRIALEHEPLHPAQVRPERRGVDSTSPRTPGWVRLLERMGGSFLSGLAAHAPLPDMEEELRV